MWIERRVVSAMLSPDYHLVAVLSHGQVMHNDRVNMNGDEYRKGGRAELKKCLGLPPGVAPV